MTDAVELIACETCGKGEEGQPTGGAQLLTLLRERPAAHVRVSSVRCLWACTRSCTVHLRSAGRVGYVIGDLAPREEFAAALVQFANQYAATPDGAVPLKTRPEALRGHFICRIPSP